MKIESSRKLYSFKEAYIITLQALRTMPQFRRSKRIGEIDQQIIERIMFAQHYADSRGNPSKESWERIIETYGLSKAKGILGAIRMIMMGNVYGIPWGFFLSRIKGKPDQKSSLFYELGFMIVSIFFLILATYIN